MQHNLSWLIEWFCNQRQGHWENTFGILIAGFNYCEWNLDVNLNETVIRAKEFEPIKMNRVELNSINCSIKNDLFRGVGGPFNFPELLQIFRSWAESHSGKNDEKKIQRENRYVVCQVCGLEQEEKKGDLEGCVGCGSVWGIYDRVLEKIRKYKDKANNEFLKKIPVNDYPFFKLKNQQWEDNFVWLTHWFYDHCVDYWDGDFSVQIKSLNYPGWLLEIHCKDTDLEDLPFSTIEIERSELDWIWCFVEKGVFYGVGGPCNLPEILQIFREWGDIYPDERHKKLPHIYCRVCGLEQEEYPWGENDDLPTFEMCDCCGAEFGCHDHDLDAIRAKRDEWQEDPEKWFRPDKKPLDWSYEDQMMQINEVYF